MAATMSPRPSSSFYSRNAPIVGAALVVGALGSLVWALSASDGRARSEPPPPSSVRGAPIRSELPNAKSADSPRVTPAAAENAAPANRAGYKEIPFATLSGYDYPKSKSMPTAATEAAASEPAAPPSARPPTKIPADVRALDATRVTIKGFMQPIDFDAEGVKSFALTAIPGGCCFGAIPRLNEWVVVHMPDDQRAEYAYYDPVRISGEISIGEIYSGDTVLSLYRMVPDKVEIGYE